MGGRFNGLTVTGEKYLPPERQGPHGRTQTDLHRQVPGESVVVLS